VQKDHHRPVAGAGLAEADIQGAGIDLFQWAERGIRARLDRRNARLSHLVGLRIGTTDGSELGGSDRHGGSSQKAPAMVVDFCTHGLPSIALCRDLGPHCHRG
jgi:hypothetical protein